MNDLVIHFIDVDCGNMTLVLFPNGTTYLYDCNLTDGNKGAILAYLRKAMGSRKRIDIFICSHRDADHMRGLRKIHNAYPIGEIRDPDVPGTTIDSPEYCDYMALRREIGSRTIEARTKLEVGNATVRYMNAADDDLYDANDQSVVMKIEYAGSAVLLAGDTSFRPWKESILPFYSDEKLRADILLGSHHGSLTFFDDPSDEKNYYTAHIKKIAPAMTLLSVGSNVWDLPDDKTIELYTRYSSGSNNGNKVFRTDEKGNMKLVLKSGGGWSLNVNQ
jgi:beta-lactamase superfamily II metal-dependent hydrolase